MTIMMSSLYVTPSVVTEIPTPCSVFLGTPNKSNSIHEECEKGFIMLIVTGIKVQ